MGSMFSQMFLAFGMFFKGLGHFMSAFCNIGEWTNEASASFVDEARADRDQKKAALLVRNQQSAGTTAALTSSAATQP
jgi:hypothetical protein